MISWGILHESFQDRLDVIQDNQKSQKSQSVIGDQNNMTKKACFEAAARYFTDKSIVISHPNKWNNACDMHGDPDLELNNPEHIAYPWNGGKDMAKQHV